MSDAFPFTVEYPIPQAGLGSVLAELTAWCDTEVGKGKWSFNKRDNTTAAFRFKDEYRAQAFRRRFIDDSG